MDTSDSNNNINIICAKNVDIFAQAEKQLRIVLEYEKFGNKEETPCKIKMNDKQLTVVSEDNIILESLHFSQRVIHGKNFIILFASDSANYRKHPRVLKFQTEIVVQKLIKIIWMHKNKEAGFLTSDIVSNDNKEIPSCPSSEIPPTTITHSNHDLAAVFSYEERQAPIKVWTSKNSSTKYPCQIHIDVEKETILIKPMEGGPFEISFSQRSSRNYDTLTFAMQPLTDNEKLKLTFIDKETGEKVDKIMENVKARKKAIKAEQLSLTIMLQKLVQEPTSINDIKKILKYYSTSFTIFKEEYRKIALEIYQAYNFRDRIFPSTSNAMSNATEVLGVAIKQEISELSNSDSPVRKRKHVDGVADVKLPIKVIKKNDDEEIIRYPNFDFLNDEKGVPKKKLIIFASNDRESRYEFSPTFRPHYDTTQFSCRQCDTLNPSNHVTAKYCVNEFGESFVKVNGKHICRPQISKKIKDYEYTVFERHNYKGYKEISYPSNTKIIPRKTTTQWSKILMIFTPSKTAYYHYKEFSQNGLYYCFECKEKDKYVFARCLKLKKNKEGFEILDEDHICTPKEYKLPEMIAECDNDSDE